MDSLIGHVLEALLQSILHMIHETLQYEAETKWMRAKLNFTSIFVDSSSRTGQ